MIHWYICFALLNHKTEFKKYQALIQYFICLFTGLEFLNFDFWIHGHCASMSCFWLHIIIHPSYMLCLYVSLEKIIALVLTRPTYLWVILILPWIISACDFLSIMQAFIFPLFEPCLRPVEQAMIKKFSLLVISCLRDLGNNA